MSITDKLLELDKTLEHHNEGSWDKPFSEDEPGFSSFNDAGIECETGEFLYSLVRLLKPERVLETGTHWGVGASYMGMALKDNKKGHLDTIEFLPEIYRRAQERINVMGLNEIVTLHLTDARAFLPEKTINTPEKGSEGSKSTTEPQNSLNQIYELILLDTEPQTRFFELLKFFPYLKDGGFIFIHDLHRHLHQIPNEEHGFAWPYGRVPQDMIDLVRAGQLRPFHFDTPRGLTGFYKTSLKDYKWKNQSEA